MAQIRQIAKAARIPGSKKLNRRGVLNTSAPRKKDAAQPQNCQSVIVVRVGSTVRAAEMNCQPSQSKGKRKIHFRIIGRTEISVCRFKPPADNSPSPREEGERVLASFLSLSVERDEGANISTIAASGKNIQFAQCAGHESLINSDSEVGAEIFWSRMTGSPNFKIQKPRKQPNTSAQMSVAAIVFPDVMAAVCPYLLKNAISASRLPAREPPERWYEAAAVFLRAFAGFRGPVAGKSCRPGPACRPTAGNSGGLFQRPE